MGQIIRNGNVYGGGGNQVILTKAEYDALPDTKLTDGVMYCISDEDMEGQPLPFKFGIDENGNYGYYKVGADTLTPFKSGDDSPSYVYYHDEFHYDTKTVNIEIPFKGTECKIAVIGNVLECSLGMNGESYPTSDRGQRWVRWGEWDLVLNTDISLYYSGTQDSNVEVFILKK